MLESLDGRIESIISDDIIFGKILSRKEEFTRNKDRGIDEKFSELTFCTRTANTSAEMGLKCQEYLDTLQQFDLESLR